MSRYPFVAAAALLLCLSVSASVAAQSVDLRINSISDNPTDITLGQGNVTYTVGIYNASSTGATNVVLTNTLPASAVYVSSTVANGGTCVDAGGGTVTCSWPTIGAFNSYNATITVTPGAGGTNSFTASVAASEADPTPANNTATETTTVNATINLAVTSISDNPADITLGQGNVTYTINTYNYSTSKATNIVLATTLPASSAYVSHTVNGSGTCTESGGVLTCNWAQQNAFTGYQMTVTVTPGVGGTNTLTSTISAEQGDPTPSNNTVSEPTTVNATINLGISSISDSPADITLGYGNVTYTINTYNYSTSKATNVVLTTNLPASSAYVSHTVNGSGTCTESGGVLTCNWTQQNAFTGYQVTVTVTPGAGGTNTLTSTISAEQGDPTPANNTASESTTVNATINLGISSMSDSPTDITLGQGNVTYTINTYNYSTSKATNVVLTANLPASSAYVSHTVNGSGTCTESGGVLTCNWTQQNAFTGYQVTVTVTPGAGGTNTLTATISAEQGDPTPANNTASESTTVNATINLGISSISDNPTDITLGQGNVTYTINTYNYSTSKATNPVVTVTLPASSTYVSHTVTTTNGGACTPSGSTLTCSWTQQPANTLHQIVVTVTPGAGGANTLSASIAADQGDPTPANNTASESTVVNATIDLGVAAISDNPNDITLNQGNVVYTINTYNYTSSKATNPVVTVSLPASSTYVSHTVTTTNGGACTQAGGTLTCTWTQQPAYTTHQIVVTVTPGAGGTNTLSASIAADQGDPAPANNTLSESTVVNATINLSVNNINDNPADITLGQGNVVYTVNTYNYTSSKATNSVVTVTLPASSTYVSHTVTTTNGGTCTQAGGTLTCTWTQHPAYTTHQITVTVTPGAGGTNTLSATISADQGDPTPSNNTLSENTTVNATIDLQLSMSDTPDPRVLAAGNVTYNVSFYNANSSKGTNPVLTFNVPATTTYVSATPSTGGTCSASGSVVTCSWPDVAGFSTRTAAIVVTPTAAGQISATASVAGDQPDSNTANNSVTATTNINPGSAPTITAFSPVSGPAGMTVTITGNNFFSSSSVKFNGTFASFTVANNGSISATVPAGATTGPISVTNGMGTGTSASSFTVTQKPDLTVAKTASAASVPTGGALTYTITVNNTGNGATHDVTVTDVLPAGVAFVSAAGTGWSCSGTSTVTCTMGPLAATTTAPAIVINVNAPATGTTITNTVNVATITPETSTANNSASVSVSVVGCPGPPAITAPPAVCKNTTGHSATTPPVPNATNYIWSVTNGTISGGQGTPAITFDAGPSGPITVGVDVFVTSCATASNSVSIPVSAPAATITASGPTSFCPGGSVTLTANNGSAWLWSTGATTQSITVSTSETVTVDVTNADGCTATSAPTTVTLFPAATTPIVSAGGPTTFCAGGSVTLISSESAGNQWKLDGAPIGGATGQNFVASFSGNYTVVYTDGNGCSTESAAMAVTATTPPAQPAISASGPTSFCSGGNVTLTSSSATGNQWKLNGVPLGGEVNPSLVATASGNYTVVVTDGNNCSSESAPTTVTVNPVPAVPTITAGGPTTFCSGGSVTLTASAADAWLWSTGATTQSITISASGNYTVQAVSGDGCPSAPSPATTVTVNPAPSAPVISADGPTTFCTGGSVTLTASPADSWLWSNGATTQSINVTSSGTFTVQITDANGCTSAASAPVTVTADPAPPTPAITPSGPTTFCGGGSVTLTAPAAAAWLWSNGATTQSITVNASGTFTVQVSNGSGCTATSAPVTVTVNNPAPVSITGPATTCANATVTLDAGPGASWIWNTGATTQQINVTPSVTTTYTVTVTDANGCTAVDAHTVTVDPTPVATITAPAGVCENSIASASVPAQSGATYVWTITNGVFTMPPNGNIVTFSAGTSGNVTLNANVSIGQCAASGNVQVPITAYPTVTIAGPTSICANDSLTLSVPPSFASYLWSNGATGPSITVNQTAASQTYTVTVTDANGCAATDTHTVTLSSQPDATITAPASAPIESSQTASVPPQPGATYLWSIFNGSITAGQGTNEITFFTGNTGPTNLIVEVTLAGCTANNGTSIVLTDPNPPPCETVPPELTAPAIGAIVPSPVLLEWTPVTGATSYDVWIDGALFGTAATTSLSAVLPGGPHTWNVIANLGNGCNPLPSASRTFTVPVSDPADPCARAIAVPVAPANGATLTSSSVLFRWSAALGATGYRVWAANGGDDFAVVGTTTEDSLRATLENGSTVWFVESLYPGCASTESQRFRFVVPAAQSCGTALPQPVSPAPGSTLTNGNVTFVWNGVPNALGYEVYLGLNGGTPALIGSTTGGTSLNYTVPAGTLQWFVRALVDRCPSRDSAEASFTYDAPPSCEGRLRPVIVEPLDDVQSTSPLRFAWSTVSGATGYELYVVRGSAAPQLVTSTSATEANNVALAPGRLTWFVRATFGQGCPSLDSSEQTLEIVPTPAACSPLVPPVVAAPGQISVGGNLLIQWSPVPGSTGYELQVADNNAFQNAQTIATPATQHPLTPSNESSEAQPLFVRVRALDQRCTTPSVSAFGPAAVVFVLPRTLNEGSTPQSDPAPLTFTFVLGAEYAGQTFSAASRVPWLTITPASGVVAAGGTTLTVTANTAGLPVGTSLGGVSITLTSAATGIAANGSSTINTSFSVSLVTPVTSDPKNTPPPDALIIPAVAHADGINSKFQSDVRVSNTSARLMKYEVTFTPSGENGLSRGQQSTFSVEPGQTVALDDILRTWFGTGDGSAMGTLEIRPVTEARTEPSGLSGLSSLVTFASSRTYNVTAGGTFGQYIPAVPFANFVGRERILSLQQIAQSSKYRTNLGLVEGSGDSASLSVRIFGQSGEYLTEFPVNLKGGQHLQLNSFLRDQGLDSLEDGRVEVEVLSGNGKVTAYASVLDNETSDPLLVTPVTVDSAGATKWIVPGVADLVSGFANWQTDMRLFNASTTPVDVTLSFYSQSGAEPKVRTLTIAPGQVRQFDKTLASLFQTTNDGGAVHITTAEPAKLIATARTYNETSAGSYGQFISAVTIAETAGVDSRPLQLLQVEETDRFRSNIGLTEVTGNEVTLEISVVPPDAKFTAIAEVTLKPNEFRQMGSLLASMGLDDTYNARVTVRAISGTGRVTAYASVIDMETNDPTYIPAQ